MKRPDPAVEAKRQRRLERKEREAAARQRAARRARLRVVAVAVVAVGVLGTGLYFLLRPDPEVAGVERPPNQGQDHVSARAATYDAAAPTSGDHPASAPRCGATGEPLELGLAVHALEHGVVVIWYRPDVEDQPADPLLDLLSDWDSHWIISPSPGIDQPIVATAWNRRKAFDRADEGLREFVDTYRNRGPESVPCDA